jgi:hypothetical protein
MMESELNHALGFSALDKVQQGSFLPSPAPVLVRFEAWSCVYKWTDHGTLVNPKRGTVGRPQEAARALGAITEQWNEMSSILKAQFLKPVWGFVGKTAWQRKFNDSRHPTQEDNIYFIGGTYQVVIPNLTTAWIKKV